MKLFGSTKSKTIKLENGVNVPHLEITDVVLVHCNIQGIIQKKSTSGSRMLSFVTFDKKCPFCQK